MSLKVSATFPAMPGQFMGSRTEKSPLLSVFKAVRRVPESISSMGEAGRVAICLTLLDGMTARADPSMRLERNRKPRAREVPRRDDSNERGGLVFLRSWVDQAARGGSAKR